MRHLPFVTLLACACASATREPTPVPTDGGRGRAAVPAEAVWSVPSAAETAQPVAAGEGTRQDELPPELRIFRDPGFRRRFAESYAAETDVEPRVTAAEREAMQQALERLAEEQPEAALALIVRVWGPASSAAIDFTAGNLHLGAERLDEAAAAYGAAVAKVPRFRRAWRNLALVHVRREEPAEAARALTRVIELGGGDAIVWGLLGFARGSLDDPLAAESAYRMACLLDPATPDWRMGLARSLFRQQRFADAAALCETLIGGDPERPDLWMLQANAFLGLGQPMRAAENLELVDRMGRSTADGLFLLADIYVNQDLPGQAVETYVRAMDKDAAPRPGRALAAAKVLVSRGATAEVARLLGRLEVLPEGALDAGERKELLRLRARLAVATGAAEEEARILEEIVALDPLDGEALLLLGLHASRSGDPERAVFWYERAASLETAEAEARLRHAQLLVGRARYGEALPLLRRSLALRPDANVQTYLEQVERMAGR